ncbi:ABC transporter substrate-binding protein [Clostridium sp. KNHs216]|uniref:ABC transporter substrate-binding protein n=1 Tax=Clostridium sp. KNHs216 TaxID=1550235 RepID=UPI00114F5698|nr:ABC transporter substrate-binding protein [Clostridium sp. KNHs216]TQI66104.1 branched-chain amino acid transport system substrate-binding protein [Clostridium sp. KNHs216]
MKRRIIAAIISLILVGSLIGCSKDPSGTSGSSDAGSNRSASTDGDTILIGVSASKSGSAPVNGMRTEQGAQMAADEINAAGGVLGKKIKLYVADDGGTTDTAINAINLILSQNVIAQLGPNLSGLTLAIEQSMADAGVPFLTGATSPKLVTTIDNKYLFRVRASDSIQGQIAAKYITEDLKCKKIGFLTDSDDYGAGALEVASAYFDKQGIKWVSETFNSGDTDLTSQILNLQKAGVDGIIVWAHDTETALAARQFNDLGVQVPIVGSTSISTTQVLDLCEEDWLTNWYSVTDFTPTNPNEKVKAFVENFQKSYGGDKPELYASTYYSALYVLADAIKRAGSTDRNAIRDALAKTDGYEGVLATYTPNSKQEMVHQGIVCKIKGKEAVYGNTVTVEVEA